MPSAEGRDRLTARAAAGAVLVITLIGLVPRLIHLDLSIIGDELSTLYVVSDRSLPDVISLVASDAEISPPLYFVLSWLSTQLGSAPELLRLPALIAGVFVIPLTYLVGARAIGRRAGLIAAAAMALNPFMVFYSTDGRAYTVAIALLLGSTLAMLVAAQGGRTRWWVAYAALSCLAMYTHYTAAFVLGAQLLWLLWAHPAARKPALIANVAAAVAFTPWLPSMLADLGSPTTDVLEALQGDGFAVKRLAVETWAYGYPGSSLDEVPGNYLRWIVPLGFAIAVMGAVALHLRRRRSGLGRSASTPGVRGGVALVVGIAVATPLAEAILLLAGGPDLFGARNLNLSSGGLALTIGAVLSGAGALVGALCLAAVIGGFAVGTAKTLEDEVSSIDFAAAAARIDAEAEVNDVVVDSISAGVTPVPLTPLDVYLEGGLSEYRLGLAEGSPPFLEETSVVAPPNALLREAFREARVAGGSLFLVAPPIAVDIAMGDVRPMLSTDPGTVDPGISGLRLSLPPGARVLTESVHPGIRDVHVLEIDPGPGPNSPGAGAR